MKLTKEMFKFQPSPRDDRDYLAKNLLMDEKDEIQVSSDF